MSRDFWSDLIGLTANAAVSVAISWAIAAYFFKKVTRNEMLSEQIKLGLQRTLLQLIHPQFFDSARTKVLKPNQRTPSDTDIPHIEYAVISESQIRPGMIVGLLLKVRDSGFDLDNPEGIAIRDHNKSSVDIVPLGLGYCTAKIAFARDVVPGHYEITVRLVDLGEQSRSGPNENTQTLTLHVEGDIDERPPFAFESRIPQASS